ncbi:MAG: LysE family translocator [Thiotrichales bacterium]
MLISWFMVAASCLLGAMSPGPSLIVVLDQAVSKGRLAGSLTACSHGLGVGIYAALSIFGLSLVITESPLLYNILRWAGSGYLIWLGINILRQTHHASGHSGQHKTVPISQQPIVLGLTTALTNPKVLLFFFALFSQLVPQDSSIGIKLLYTFTAVFIDAGWYILIAIFASQPIITKRLKTHEQWIERCFALLLMAIGLKIVLSE